VTNRQTDMQIDIQTDRRAFRQTNRQADRQTDRQTLVSENTFFKNQIDHWKCKNPSLATEGLVVYFLKLTYNFMITYFRNIS